MRACRSYTKDGSGDMRPTVDDRTIDSESDGTDGRGAETGKEGVLDNSLLEIPVGGIAHHEDIGKDSAV